MGSFFITTNSMVGNLRNCLFVLTIVFTITSCKTTSKKSNVIAFDFFNTPESFHDGDWIKIDDYRFEHFSTRPDSGIIADLIFPLPANVVKDSIGTREKLTKVGNSSIAMRLALHIKHINDEFIDDKDEEYIILDPHLITIKGMLKLMKADSSKIEVRLSKNNSLKVIEY